MSEPSPDSSTKQAAKLKIISMDDNTEVEGTFNPKEVSIDKSVPWSKHKNSKTDQPHLEFTGAEPMTMSFELLFDGAEKGDDGDVKPMVEKLLTLAKIYGSEKRPHRIQVLWGSAGKLPEFTGVIESVGTKFQMFTAAGTPVRATCTIKCKQATQWSFKK